MEEKFYTVTIDRPIGSSHPEHPAMVYPINYGYVEEITGGDGEPQDAYVLGIDTAIDQFYGRLIAVIHRRDDIEEKWVIAPDGMSFNKQQIEELVYFTEQYYDSYIEMLDDELWDAYDADEKLLGYCVPRSMAKSLDKGVYHVVVEIYTVMPDNRLLITQRSKNKTYALQWEITGGSILAGESPIEGAARELQEETGICQPLNAFTEVYSYSDHKKHVIYHIYLTKVTEDVAIHLQYGETMDYRFLEYDELKKFINSDKFVPPAKGRFLTHETLMDNAVKKILDKE